MIIMRVTWVGHNKDPGLYTAGFLFMWLKMGDDSDSFFHLLRQFPSKAQVSLVLVLSRITTGQQKEGMATSGQGGGGLQACQDVTNPHYWYHACPLGCLLDLRLKCYNPRFMFEIDAEYSKCVCLEGHDILSGLAESS